VKSKLPILLYHDLESPECPNEKTNRAARDTVVTASNFEGQIKKLVDKGYTSISLSDYFDFKCSKSPLPSRPLIITFDDGHYSNYSLALPVLKKYGFKGTFFIVTDRIDQEFHLSREQVAQMALEGMEIGSHGVTHQFLPKLDSSGIEYEMGESRDVLESILNQCVKYFAFPGGHYNKNVLELLSFCGYKAACSCLQGLNNTNTNKYLLKRIEVRGKLTVDAFSRIFSRSHIALYQFIDLWKNFIRRSIGLDAYSRLRSRFYNYYFFKR